MEPLSRRAMRLTLNNTAVFGEQARRLGVSGPNRAVARGLLAAQIAFAAALTPAAGGCRKKKAPAASSASMPADLPPVRPPPPPAETLPTADALPPPPASARGGGSLRVHLDAEPASLLPFTDADAAALQVTTGLVYETLLDCTDGGYRPRLAESWDISDDGMRIAVRVRSGVRWHDHKTFGVLDVQATFEPLLRSSPEPSTLRALLADVATVDLVTERTVRFALKQPSDFALRALCEVPILPEHLIRGVRIESAPIARQPIGTGPFRFAGWERGKRIRLERAASNGGAASGPTVDEIVFDLDGDAVRALNRTRRGELDILTRVLDVHYPEQVEPTTLHGNTALYRLPSRRYSFLVANHRHYPLSDPRFRRAIAKLWDRKRFSTELHDELARPIGGPPLASADLAAPELDRRSAIQALEDAGYRDTNDDGVRDHLGRAIRLTLLEPAGNKLFNVEAKAFALEARKAGILIDVVPADPGTILGRARRGEFDLVPMMWQGMADEDPRVLYGAGAPFNYGGYRSSALEAMIDEARTASGPAARAPILERIARLLADEQPVIYLYRYDVPSLVSARVRGLAADGHRFDLRRVWLE